MKLHYEYFVYQTRLLVYLIGNVYERHAHRQMKGMQLKYLKEICNERNANNMSSTIVNYNKF